MSIPTKIRKDARPKNTSIIATPPFLPSFPFDYLTRSSSSKLKRSEYGRRPWCWVARRQTVGRPSPGIIITVMMIGGESFERSHHLLWPGSSQLKIDCALNEFRLLCDAASEMFFHIFTGIDQTRNLWISLSHFPVMLQACLQRLKTEYRRNWKQ